MAENKIAIPTWVTAENFPFCTQRGYNWAYIFYP